MKITLFITLLLISLSTIAQDLYIKSVEAKLLATPSSDAATVATLKRGAIVTKISEQGMWVEVKTQNQTGFISKFMVTTEAPTGTVSALENQKDLSSSARKRASAFTSAGAARGLKASKDDLSKTAQEGDLKALKKVEANYVEPAEAQKQLPLEED